MSRRQIALALQGGGSHGAYTWGVLDRLLEDDGVDIEGLSGASAGAVNAAVLASGYAGGGREGARAALDGFWKAISSTPYSVGTTATAHRPDPGARGYLFLARLFSPAQLNPLNINPLRDILAKQVDFDRLRADASLKLFISATRVSDGGLRIFTREELTLEALLASACIPSIHRTVEVDGVAYWDGGLAANPPLSALVYGCDTHEFVIVVLNPHASDAVPASAEAIGQRLTEISFSSTLPNELHAIASAKAEAQKSRFAWGRLERKLKRLKLHVIDSGAYMAEFDPASRLNTDATFITALRDAGRARADAWLRRNDAGTQASTYQDALFIKACA